MAKSSQNPAVNRPEKRKKSLRLSSLFQDFLNPVVAAKKWLKRLAVPTISTCLFHNSQRRIFNPQKICFILQTLDSHRMCCSISFTCNKLDSARMKESRQILHISEQTEVHVEMPTLRQSLPTEYPCININLNPFLRRGHPFNHGSWLRVLQIQSATPILQAKAPHDEAIK
ncbi:hypothetical protein E1A91_A02G080200v1 [Gossypium mustelinum]|uniref:Uncharacterized protein n=1 Tax=Gossypium mustelinum TaxID=34275 RepID=A0A5D3A6H8_GOSMU|nr:hypothetical protein E1A91_A02G080200v1 [Gossypium mustelinum]